MYYKPRNSAVHHLFYLKIRIQVIKVECTNIYKHRVTSFINTLRWLCLHTLKCCDLCVSVYLWETISHERDPKSPSFPLRIIVFRIFMKTNTLGRVRNIWTTSHYTSIGISSRKKPKSENCGIDANRICKLLQTRVTPATSLDPIFREVIRTAKI